MIFATCVLFELGHSTLELKALRVKYGQYRPRCRKIDRRGEPLARVGFAGFGFMH
jgi:hypothetical protein